MLDDDAWRDGDLDRREVPDGFDAGMHQLIRQVLGRFRWDGEDPDLYAHPLHHIVKLADMEYLYAVDRLPDLFPVDIECGNYVEAIFLEPFKTEERRPEMSDTDQIRIFRVVPSEELLDDGDKLIDGVPELRLAHRVGDAEVLTDLDGEDGQIVSYLRA